jgi:hypothetical protein
LKNLFHLPWPRYFFAGLLFFEWTPLFFLLGFGCQLADAVLFAFAILQAVKF